MALQPRRDAAYSVPPLPDLFSSFRCVRGLYGKRRKAQIIVLMASVTAVYRSIETPGSGSADQGQK